MALVTNSARRLLTGSALAAALLLANGAAGVAAQITYSFTGSMSGSLDGGNPGTLSNVSLIGVGDTDGVVVFGNGTRCNDLSSLALEAMGNTAQFVGSFTIFDNTSHGNVGIGVGTCSAFQYDWFYVHNGAFAGSWDLASDLGPVPTTPMFTDTVHTLNLQLGNTPHTILLSSQNMSTFQADANVLVPTLSGWAMAGLSACLALIGLFALRRPSV
jgi:hypothetical protein